MQGWHRVGHLKATPPSQALLLLQLLVLLVR
jgi:hypothetical protein